MDQAPALWQRLLADAGERTLHATLLDPATTPPGEAAKLAEWLAEVGTDLLLVGGSTGVTAELVQETVEALKGASRVPVVLFPSSHKQVATGLDGVLYTITFNSERQELIIEEPSRGARLIGPSGIEPITTAYVIVEPGMTVGRVAQARLVSRDEEGASRIARYAHLARVLHFDAVYLEAGSGAPEPVPPELIEAAAAAGVPVIAGGGIRTPDAALAAAHAGARVVVTGTILENGDHAGLEAIVAALRG